eukprot:CAMPEP_0202777366 /NCGR_PEP_ID=MMETSP1388-20130828/52547_1 /ASSEMBLY_ACC=CAM_ASM_000864 /TAXON_ID=37098 /ORGANISM="Isochrysis sp, Strain CCMP1244" /LENGTH=259 /DNA_ID=CAMNT_0049446593 /DNA_START=8 /DNA_END=783 /DNA_ORIENTATION=-
MASSSDWRRKRPKALGSHDFILGTEPPATAPAPATQLAARRKRPRTRAQRGCAVDLEATIAEGGMFAAVVAMPTAEEEEMWSGPATLCMVTPSAFIAAATVACAQGGTVKLRLRGSETSEAEQQQLCGATDCCADQAFRIEARAGGGARAPQSRKKFVARSVGLGDYLSFEGGSLVFRAEEVPAEAERAACFARAFPDMASGSLAPGGSALLCTGEIRLRWPDLARLHWTRPRHVHEWPTTCPGRPDLARRQPVHEEAR